MGAWGYEPFDNDSACDWIAVVEDHVLKALRVALRPMTRQKFHVWPRTHWPKRKIRARGKRALRLRERPKPIGSEMRLTGQGQSEGLAAVSLVRRVSELQWRQDWRSGDERTFLELSEAVLLQLQKDEGMGWREPAKYAEVLARELRAVRRLLRAQHAERDKRVATAVKRVKRLSKKARDAMMREKRAVLYSSYFRKAFKLVDGRDLPEPKLRVRHARRRKKS